MLGATDQYDWHIDVAQGPAKHCLIFAGFNSSGLHYKRFAYTSFLTKLFGIGIQKHGWINAVVSNLKAVTIPLQVVS